MLAELLAGQKRTDAGIARLETQQLESTQTLRDGLSELKDSLRKELDEFKGEIAAKHADLEQRVTELEQQGGAARTGPTGNELWLAEQRKRDLVATFPKTKAATEAGAKLYAQRALSELGCPADQVEIQGAPTSFKTKAMDPASLPEAWRDAAVPADTECWAVRVHLKDSRLAGSCLGKMGKKGADSPKARGLLLGLSLQLTKEERANVTALRKSAAFQAAVAAVPAGEKRAIQWVGDKCWVQGVEWNATMAAVKDAAAA